MKVVELKDVKPYNPPKHFNMTALKLHGMDDDGSKKLFVGMSHFLPEGGAEYDDGSIERIYVVLDGELALITDQEKIVLKATDSIHLNAGEGRKLINETNKPASMLVIFNLPEKFPGK